MFVKLALFRRLGYDKNLLYSWLISTEKESGYELKKYNMTHSVRDFK